MKNFGITYGGNSHNNEAIQMLGYSDSDWANDKDTRKSTNGYVFLVNGRAVSWKSRQQFTVALSTTKAEYIGYTEAAKEAIWLRNLLAEIDMRQPLNETNGTYSKWGQTPATILVDNQSAIDLTNNSRHHDRTKHIDIRHHFIRNAQENGLINVTHIPSEEQTADILTKLLAQPKFEQHRRGMGVGAMEGIWKN
jgi:hypothetical protein